MIVRMLHIMYISKALLLYFFCKLLQERSLLFSRDVLFHFRVCVFAICKDGASGEQWGYRNPGTERIIKNENLWH